MASFTQQCSKLGTTFPVHRWGNLEFKKLNNMPKTAQLIRDRIGIF